MSRRLAGFAVAALVLFGCGSDDQNAACEAFDGPLPGVEVIEWENGITRSSADWWSALQEFDEADADSQAALREALLENAATFEAGLEGFEPEERSALELLFGDATGDSDGASDAEKLEASRLLSTWHFEECGIPLI